MARKAGEQPSVQSLYFKAILPLLAFRQNATSNTNNRKLLQSNMLCGLEAKPTHKSSNVHNQLPVATDFLHCSAAYSSCSTAGSLICRSHNCLRSLLGCTSEQERKSCLRGSSRCHSLRSRHCCEMLSQRIPLECHVSIRRHWG